MSLTHFDAQGRAAMVDVSGKEISIRIATARGRVTMSAATATVIKEGSAKKGDVLGVARIAGIMAAKQTAALIPLCHPLPIDAVTIELTAVSEAVEIEATVRTAGRTGVEMEALTAVSVSALTIYDMCKSLDRSMRITDIRLGFKEGGKSGVFSQD